MKIDEYVPTMIPTTNAKANPRSTGPPNINRHTALSNVKPPVRIVRLSVWLIDTLIRFGSDFALHQLQILAHAVEDDDLVIHRIADKSEKSRDHRQRKLEIEDRKQAHRHQRVVQHSDDGRDTGDPLEPERNIHQHAAQCIEGRQ